MVDRMKWKTAHAAKRTLLWKKAVNVNNAEPTKMMIAYDTIRRNMRCTHDREPDFQPDAKRAFAIFIIAFDWFYFSWEKMFWFHHFTILKFIFSLFSVQLQWYEKSSNINSIQMNVKSVLAPEICTHNIISKSDVIVTSYLHFFQQQQLFFISIFHFFSLERKRTLEKMSKFP